jgi:hypothetical protein
MKKLIRLKGELIYQVKRELGSLEGQSGPSKQMYMPINKCIPIMTLFQVKMYKVVEYSFNTFLFKYDVVTFRCKEASFGYCLPCAMLTGPSQGPSVKDETPVSK